MQKIVPWIITGGAVLVLIVIIGISFFNQTKVAQPFQENSSSATTSKIISKTSNSTTTSASENIKYSSVTPSASDSNRKSFIATSNSNSDTSDEVPPMRPISAFNFQDVPYHIPVRLVLASSSYKRGDIITVSYNYPTTLAGFKNDSLDRVFGCGDVNDKVQLASPRMYLLDNTSGHLLLFLPGGTLTTKQGENIATFSVDDIYNNDLFKPINSSNGSTSYRFILIVNKVAVTCDKAVESPTADEGTDAGYLQWWAKYASFELGVGYTTSFKLR